MIDKNKASNFWYYNKVKIIIIVIIISVAAFLFYITGGQASPDVEIAYVTDGRMVSKETIEYLNQCFAQGIRDVDGDQKRTTALIPLVGPRISMEFVAEGSQLVLLDGFTLENFIGSGIFEPLDDYAGKFNVDPDRYPGITANYGTDDRAHTYAIPVGCIPMLLEIGFPAENYFLVKRASKSSDVSMRAKAENAYGILDILVGYDTR